MSLYMERPTRGSVDGKDRTDQPVSSLPELVSCQAQCCLQKRHPDGQCLPIPVPKMGTMDSFASGSRTIQSLALQCVPKWVEGLDGGRES